MLHTGFCLVVCPAQTFYQNDYIKTQCYSNTSGFPHDYKPVLQEKLLKKIKGNYIEFGKRKNSSVVYLLFKNMNNLSEKVYMVHMPMTEGSYNVCVQSIVSVL